MVYSMKLAVCIPAAAKDLYYLQACLRSIQAQTRLPDLIVVSISDAKEPPAIDLSGITVPIEILHSPETIHPGGNRNRAARVAVTAGADILSFFDADDMMHPRRLERIEAIFTEHPELIGVVHGFIYGPKGNKSIYEGTVHIPWDPLQCQLTKDSLATHSGAGWNFIHVSKTPENMPPSYGAVQNGHVSVRAFYWEQEQFRETVGPYGYCEDSHFVASILNNQFPLGYTWDTLSLYQRIEAPGFVHRL